MWACALHLWGAVLLRDPWLAWCLTVTSIHWLPRGGHDESLVLGEAIVLADKAYPCGVCRFAETSQRWKLKAEVTSTLPTTTLDASLNSALHAAPTNKILASVNTTMYFWCKPTYILILFLVNVTVK